MYLLSTFNKCWLTTTGRWNFSLKDNEVEHRKVFSQVINFNKLLIRFCYLHPKLYEELSRELHSYCITFSNQNGLKYTDPLFRTPKKQNFTVLEYIWNTLFSFKQRIYLTKFLQMKLPSVMISELITEMSMEKTETWARFMRWF